MTTPEIRFAEDRWNQRVDVWFELTDAPEAKPAYGGQAFRPQQAHVQFERSTNDANWRLSDLKISGPRILKGGRLGQDWRDRKWYYARGGINLDGAYEWLRPVIEAARARVENPVAD